jgi:hypothetical protein
MHYDEPTTFRPAPKPVPKNPDGSMRNAVAVIIVLTIALFWTIASIPTSSPNSTAAAKPTVTARDRAIFEGYHTLLTKITEAATAAYGEAGEEAKWLEFVTAGKAAAVAAVCRDHGITEAELVAIRERVTQAIGREAATRLGR